MHATKFFYVVCAGLLLGGCVGMKPVQPVAGADSAMAFGNIQIPNRVLTNVTLYEYGVVYAAPFKSPPYSHTYTNGNFLFENLKPGKYFLMSFASGNEIFYFNYRGLSREEMEDLLIEVKPGGMVYLGSYAVTGIDDNWFKADTFDIEMVDEPKEKEILTGLLTATEGTGWDERINRRLARLR